MSHGLEQQEGVLPGCVFTGLFSGLITVCDHTWVFQILLSSEQKLPCPFQTGRGEVCLEFGPEMIVIVYYSFLLQRLALVISVH